MPSKGEKRLRSLVKASLAYHSLDDYPGFCYFALLPDGNIKIGFSHTEKLVAARMRTLSRQYGAPVIPLAVIKGGFAAEAHMHGLFEEHRLPGDGERFQYAPEIAAFIDSVR